MYTQEATLKQITDAISRSYQMDASDSQKLYSRARTMRDRGIISTNSLTQQGQETKYSRADIAAAIVAINISLNGGSQGKIRSINRDLREFGENQSGCQSIPGYETWIDEITSGKEKIYIRHDVYVLPWRQTKSRMGTIRFVEDAFCGKDTNGHPYLISESSLIHVTDLVRPVLIELTLLSDSR